MYRHFSNSGKLKNSSIQLFKGIKTSSVNIFKFKEFVHILSWPFQGAIINIAGDCIAHKQQKVIFHPSGVWEVLPDCATDLVSGEGSLPGS